MAAGSPRGRSNGGGKVPLPGNGATMLHHQRAGSTRGRSNGGGKVPLPGNGGDDAAATRGRVAPAGVVMACASLRSYLRHQRGVPLWTPPSRLEVGV